MAELGSEWGSLAESLIAVIAACDRDGKTIPAEQRKDFPDDVRAPVREGSMEINFNWSSPFEQSGAESKAPALTALLQAGSLAESAQQMSALFGNLPIIGKQITSAAKATVKTVIHAQNRSSMTKMNSTQVFTGGSPIKISASLVFRAVKSPQTEVEKPIAALMYLAHPQILADNLRLGKATNTETSSAKTVIDALMPSIAPTPVALSYGERRYAPLVILSLSRPLVVARAAGGELECEVNCTLGGLRSWDIADLKKILVKG